MRLTLRSGIHCQLDDLVDLGLRDRRFRATSWVLGTRSFSTSADPRGSVYPPVEVACHCDRSAWEFHLAGLRAGWPEALSAALEGSAGGAGGRPRGRPVS